MKQNNGKKSLFRLLTGCFLLLAAITLISCQDELPEAVRIEKGKETVAFAVDGGSTTVKIISNGSWKAVSSQSWLTVSPASGGSGTHTITLSAGANTTDGQRSATVTLQVGHKTSTITVSQAQKDVLGLLTASTTVAWTSGTYDMVFQTNISGYEFKTDADWLQPAGTKAVAEKTLMLNYSENPGYEARTGRITISKGTLNTTFTLTQGGRGALYFVLESDEVGAEDTGYELKLMKNTSASGLHLIDAVDWLHLPTDTRAIPVEESVLLTLDVNTASTPRSARLVIGDESTGVLLTDTFTLTQKGLEDILRPGFTAYEAKAEGETFDLPVTASGPFEVLLPEDAGWLTGSEGVQLPGTLQFTVAPNTKAQPRTAVVTLRLQGGETGSASGQDAMLTVTQAAADVSDVERIPKLYNLLEVATVVETNPVNLGAFRATVTYDRGEPSGWISDIYANGGKLHFKVDDNSHSASKRSAVINLLFETGEIAGVRINQSGNSQVYMEMEKPGTLASFVDFSHSGSYKKICVKSETGLNGDDFNTLRNATLAVEEADLSEVGMLTGLPDGVFAGQTTLRSIILPKTIQRIGSHAFAGSRIEKIVFAGSKPELQEIGASAFEGCSELQEIPLSEKLTVIGEKAFAHAFTGGSFTVADLSGATALNTISAGAFEGCNTLTELKLPVNLVEIGDGAFRECYNLSGQLVLPSALKTLGAEAFYNNKNLKGVLTLPSTLTALGDRAFMKCALLTELKMQEAKLLKAVGAEAFKESLASPVSDYVLVLPQGMTTVGRSAFEDIGAEAVDLPSTLTGIESRAFYNCRNLSEVTCLATVPPALSATNTADTFGGAATITSRTLKVPSASAQTYTDSPLWKLAVPVSGSAITWTITSY